MTTHVKSVSLRWHLLVLVLGALLPFFAFSAFVASWLVDTERATSERSLLRTAEDLASSADREIEASIRTLRALATSKDVARGDLKEFHEELRRVLKSQPAWNTILLHNPRGETVLNAARPFGAPLDPPAERESLFEVFRTREPIVGRLARGSNRFAFAVRVPIFDEKNPEGSPVFVLSAVIAPSSFQDIVTRSIKDGDTVHTLIDAGGRVVARSRLIENFIGASSPTTIHEIQAGRERGIIQAASLENRQTYLAFAQAPVSKWASVVVVPTKTLDAAADYAKFWVSLIGSILITFFGSGAIWFSRRLVNSIDAASLGAAHLAGGQVPKFPITRVSEIDELQKSLTQASALLLQKDAERDELLAQAESARADAEKASRTKSDFLANMSHELRTPLGIILGVLDLHSRPEANEAERASLLERLQRNAAYLSALIDQVLDLSKVEANALEIEVRAFSPRELLNDVVTSLRTNADPKGIYINLDPVDELPRELFSDPLRLRQILINVVGNAVKFTSRGGVIVHAHYKENVFEIIVRDTGIGMTADQRERLFRPFSQADNSMTRRFGGTGLGLAVSRRFALALEGDLELIDSAPDQGSVFKISIHAEVTGHTFVSEKAPLRGDLSGLRVLVVDDSVDNRFLIQRILTLAGAETAEAEDGATGIAKALSQAFDCVLMDIQMPKMDGNEATAELRKRGFTKPIIALTAHAMKSDREKAMAAGYSDYLTKPVDKHRLIDMLAKSR